MKCRIIVALAWPFGGNDTVIFPPPPLGAVVTNDVLAAVEAGNGFGKVHVSGAMLQHKPVF